MKYLNESWTIQELCDNQGKIDPSPQFQRTLVWTAEKKMSLIDSILRGYDLPKFYLQGKDGNDGFEFKVIDGKQRINAIWEFVENKFSLSKKCIINGDDLSNVFYRDLPEDIKEKFDEAVLTITNIYEFTEESLIELFQRLQGGVSLIPTELRHAMKSKVGEDIRKLTKHPFFLKENRSYISNKRFKHQDYLDHAITLCYYKNNKSDLKAKTLMEFYIELSENSDSAKVIIGQSRKILDLMLKINLEAKGIFKNKWSFVDAFYLLYNNYSNLSEKQPSVLAERFRQLEEIRKNNIKNPEEILASNPEAYKYIVAFKTDGALKNSIKTRNEVLQSLVMENVL